MEITMAGLIIFGKCRTNNYRILSATAEMLRLSAIPTVDASTPMFEPSLAEFIAGESEARKKSDLEFNCPEPFSNFGSSIAESVS